MNNFGNLGFIEYIADLMKVRMSFTASDWIKALQNAVTEIRRMRAAQNIPNNKWIQCRMPEDTEPEFEAALRHMCKLSKPDENFGKTMSLNVRIVV